MKRWLFVSVIIPALKPCEKTNGKMINQLFRQFYSFNLKDVKLLNSPFRHAMQMDGACE
jgi:hypothetical protein